MPFRGGGFKLLSDKTVEKCRAKNGTEIVFVFFALHLLTVSNSTKGHWRLANSPVCKQVTGGDLGDDCPNAVIILGDLDHQLIDHDFIVAFQLST